MATEICIRRTDESHFLVWEFGLTFHNDDVWVYPEYRKAAFETADAYLGKKIDEMMEGKRDD